MLMRLGICGLMRLLLDIPLITVLKHFTCLDFTLILRLLIHEKARQQQPLGSDSRVQRRGDKYSTRPCRHRASRAMGRGLLGLACMTVFLVVVTEVEAEAEAEAEGGNKRPVSQVMAKKVFSVMREFQLIQPWQSDWRMSWMTRARIVRSWHGGLVQTRIVFFFFFFFLLLLLLDDEMVLSMIAKASGPSLWKVSMSRALLAGLGLARPSSRIPLIWGLRSVHEPTLSRSRVQSGATRLQKLWIVSVNMTPTDLAVKPFLLFLLLLARLSFAVAGSRLHL